MSSTKHFLPATLLGLCKNLISLCLLPFHQGFCSRAVLTTFKSPTRVLTLHQHLTCHLNNTKMYLCEETKRLRQVEKLPSYFLPLSLKNLFLGRTLRKRYSYSFYPLPSQLGAWARFHGSIACCLRFLCTRSISCLLGEVKLEMFYYDFQITV